MVSLFKRFGKEETKMKIQVLLHSVEANSSQHIEDLTMKFQRGP
jgi:hypothetical protein